MAIVLIAYFAVVLALVAYFASNVGVEWRGRRSRGWIAVMGAFLAIAAAAVVILVAR